MLILSDIHVEHHVDFGKDFVNSLPKSEIVILAGDICTQSSMGILSRFCDKYEHVLYVHGNHEFYYSDKDYIFAETEKLCNKHANLHWLNNNVVEINGQRFLGNTLWFPYSAHAGYLQSGWSDFKNIQNLSSWVYEENEKAEKFLNNEVDESSIVITHYLPSYKSVSPMFIGNPTNCFFVCDKESLIMDKQPKLWVHGHTHQSFDYHIGKTRVLCNPFGYAGKAENVEFQNNLEV